MAMILASGGCGDSGTAPGTTSPESVRLDVAAVLGPLVGASVSVSALSSPDVELAAGLTTDAAILEEAGRVSLEIAKKHADEPLLIRVTGGVNVDADDDGVRDATPTPNGAQLEFVLASARELTGLWVNMNPLLLIASRYVRDNAWTRSTIGAGYRSPDTGRGILELQNRIARALVNGDVNADGTIDWRDLLAFHPLSDKAKSNMPWEAVLNELKRTQDNYFATAVLQYNRWFIINPNNLISVPLLATVSAAGLIPAETLPSRLDHVKLIFITNKSNYRIRDALWRQEDPGYGPHSAGYAATHGNFVFLQVGPKIWRCYKWETQEASTLPLNLPDCYVGLESEDPLKMTVGGEILSPPAMPSGNINIRYSTTDGRTHDEALFVYENSPETRFDVMPRIELDSAGAISRITLDFSRNGRPAGNEIPAVWAEVSMVCTSAFRGEGHYSLLGERDIFTTFPEGLCFRQPIDLLAPTEPIVPSSNERKILFEDVVEIRFSFQTGDGVQRLYRFDPKDERYYPGMRTRWDESTGRLTFYPWPGNTEPVTGFIYKWFDGVTALGDWKEVSGDAATVTPPPSATNVAYTAKGRANFYYIGYQTFWRPFRVP
jgi:hypothetical protein